MLPHGQELIPSSVHLLLHLRLGIAAAHLQIDFRRGPAQYLVSAVSGLAHVSDPTLALALGHMTMALRTLLSPTEGHG